MTHKSEINATFGTRRLVYYYTLMAPNRINTTGVRTIGIRSLRLFVLMISALCVIGLNCGCNSHVRLYIIRALIEWWYDDDGLRRHTSCLHFWCDLPTIIEIITTERQSIGLYFECDELYDVRQQDPDDETGARGIERITEVKWAWRDWICGFALKERKRNAEIKELLLYWNRSVWW